MNFGNAREILADLAVLRNLSDRIDWRIDYITTHEGDEHREDYIETLGERYDNCTGIADRIIDELKQIAAEAGDELKDMVAFFNYVASMKIPGKPQGSAPESPKQEEPPETQEIETQPTYPVDFSAGSKQRKRKAEQASSTTGAPPETQKVEGQPRSLSEGSKPRDRKAEQASKDNPKDKDKKDADA